MIAPARGLEGTQIGRYRLRFKIAEGGMAAVYLAQLGGAHDFSRWVAIKVIHANHAEDESFKKMLFDEASTASKIHHPNVCSVLDFGEHDGIVYLVMEYLEGETLSSVIRRAWTGPNGFPYWLAARTVADAARGLHAAHELRDPDGRSYDIVHRDVSPQNLVILYDGHSKVIDFGIARARSNISTTKVGQVKGKIAYLAPEQLGAGAIVDRQADVWALGVVLWEATVGRRLFRGESSAETARNVVMADIEKPRSARPFYPPELEKIVLKAIERNRGARYADAKALADDLEAFLYKRGQPAGAAQVAEYMKRHFDDRYTVRQALLGSDDSPNRGILTMQDLQSETSLGSDIGAQVEKSGRRRKPPISEPPEDPVDELLASLEEPSDDDSLAPEPDAVVDIAVVLDLEEDSDPEPQTAPRGRAPVPSEPPTTPGVKLRGKAPVPVAPAGEPDREAPPSRPRIVLPQSDPRGIAPPPIEPSKKGGRGKLVALFLVLLAALAAVYFLGISGL